MGKTNIVMDRVAFIIPAWSGDFSHLRRSLKSFISANKNEDCDVFVVMTSEKERDDFFKTSGLQFSPYIKFIWLESFTHKNNTKERGIISVKKFYGISECIKSNDYAYMIPIDCESYFLDLGDIKAACDIIYKRKSFYGGRCTEDGTGPKDRKINKACISFLNEYSESKTAFSDIDPSPFFFWYDLPVYEKTLASDFLDFIEFENTSRLGNNLRWEHFDHILYGYYCSVFHDHDIVEVEFHERGFVKRASKDVFLKMKDVFDVSLFWTTLDHYIIPKDECFDNVKVLYHIDKRLKKFEELRLL